MWVPIAGHKPTPEDADEQGCVLVWHRYQGVMMLNVRNVQNFGAYITHWMRSPAPPAATDS